MRIGMVCSLPSPSAEPGLGGCRNWLKRKSYVGSICGVQYVMTKGKRT